jgi:hypothetical protein
LFIPKPPIGANIYAYDVNSLYPFVMKAFKYPIGSPTYFEGDILKDPQLINPFGFFYVDVVTPMDLKHPILQLHHKTSHGVRTISPLGKFSGWFFSEELYNAQNFGYKFTILKGYLFKSDYIFKDYVEDLYNLRLQYDKSNPMNYTAKLLLNSLYGRFGMDDIFNRLAIVHQKELKEIEQNFNITSVTFLSNTSKKGDQYLVSFNDPEDRIITKMDGYNETHNVNIAIASAVTAYARIHMSQFKNNPSLPNLYYTDTDSAFFDGPIPDSFISSTKLGAFKLEGVYDQAIFLAPKVYALKNNQESIIKIKGVSKEAIQNNNITLESLEALLIKDSNIQINQNKWFRYLDKGTINILDQTYDLKVTSNKRELIYSEDGKFIGTNPLKIDQH